jgi:hypothetical protein
MTTTTITHERFIAFGLGYWGTGSTIEKAKKQLRKAGGRLRNGYNIYRFWSEKPFAPSERPANEDESDCWVGRDGSINWVRCEREQLGPM